MKTMRITILSSIIILTMAFTSSKGDEDQVKQTILNYAKFANDRNVDGMKVVLHDDFRSISNRLFGSENVSFTDKETYLTLLESKKIGGGDRKLTINNIAIQGHNAHASIAMKGKELSFSMFVWLLKDKNGKWAIISDLPHITS